MPPPLARTPKSINLHADIDDPVFDVSNDNDDGGSRRLEQGLMIPFNLDEGCNQGTAPRRLRQVHVSTSATTTLFTVSRRLSRAAEVAGGPPGCRP
jgi:hypothetical protein